MPKPNKNIGISRTVSPLRDKYTPRPSKPKPKFPPGEKPIRPPDSGNRWGK